MSYTMADVFVYVWDPFPVLLHNHPWSIACNKGMPSELPNKWNNWSSIEKLAWANNFFPHVTSSYLVKRWQKSSKITQMFHNYILIHFIIIVFLEPNHAILTWSASQCHVYQRCFWNAELIPMSPKQTNVGLLSGWATFCLCSQSWFKCKA